MENLKNKYGIIADYHTHTVYSHGKGTVEQNVIKAVELGLKTIAITDHGPHHFIFGVSEENLIKQASEVRALRDKYPDVNILTGVEANIKGLSGEYDIREDIRHELDIVLCGFHKPVWSDKMSDYFKLFYNSYSKALYKPTKIQIEKNTRAYVKLIQKQPIDIISHINYHLKVNVCEVAKAAADYGVAIEVSTRHDDCTKADYEELFASNCMITVNSDAHKVESIGEIGRALEVLNEYNVDPKRVINSSFCHYDFKCKNKLNLSH